VAVSAFSQAINEQELIFTTTRSFALSPVMIGNQGSTPADSKIIRPASISEPGGVWDYQNPLTGRDPLRDVHFVDAQTGWAVGEDGIIFTTSDGGMSWQSQNSGIPNDLKNRNDLQEVYFSNSQTGWVVGTSSLSGLLAPILKTSDGGLTWNYQSSQVAQGLWSLYFGDDQTGWAVGYDSDPLGRKGVIIKTTDGGTTWSLQTSSITANFVDFFSVHFINDQIGWVVGHQGGGSPSGLILKTTDGGTTWDSQTSGTTERLQSVHFFDEQTGWVVGAFGTILKTTDSGSTWTMLTSGTTQPLQSVYFIDAQNGLAVGAGSFGRLGLILKTTDGGNTWSPINSGSSNTNISLYALHFADAVIGWAVGDRGLVLKTTDGGANWTNLTSVTLNHLYSVFFLDANTGWVGGRNGTLLKTRDAGTTWTASTTSSGRSINDIYFADSKNGWACQSGGRILKTTDGGNSWTVIRTSTTRAFHAMHFIDASTGWAVGGGAVSQLIFKTTDSGNTWVAQLDLNSAQALTDVFFANSDTGWAVGISGTILTTADGGNNWTPQNSGTSDWLESIYFRDVNVGFVTGSSDMFSTTDGGNTWTPLNLGAGWIDSITLLDSLNGWAVGAIAGRLSKSIDGGGNITISGGTAKTWKTTDGGATWDDEVLPFGVWLLQTFFTDRNSGWAISTFGSILNYTDTLPLPAPPSDLIANPVSDSEIMLSWSDNSTNESGFHLYRSDSVSGAYHLTSSPGFDVTHYTDAGLTKGITYWYRINAYNKVGNSAVSLDAFATPGAIVSVENEQPVTGVFALGQNYPNPFNPTTLIQYQLSVVSNVELTIYNQLGQEVRTLVKERQSTGAYQIEWNGQDNMGKPVASGIYLYRLKAGSFIQTRKMLLLQ
jgi:photosystem II stability/assembly factor-like uncharacterized protein